MQSEHTPGPLSNHKSERSIWHGGIARPLMIAVLIACPTVAFVVMLNVFAPALATGYIIPLIFAISLLSVYNTRYFAGERWAYQRTWRIKGAQIVMLLLIVRAITLMAQGGTGAGNTIRDWFWSPAQWLLSPDFLLVGTVAVISWWQAADIEHIFWQLGDEQFFRASRPTSTGTETPSHGWGGEAVLRLTSKFVIGGILMALFIAFSRVNVSSETHLEIGVKMTRLPPALILALIGYTLLGLALISQARFISLQAGWAAQGVAMSPGLRARWLPITLLFLGAITFLAATLPTGSTTGLAHLLNAVTQALFGLVAGVLSVFLFLFGLFLSLFGFNLGPPGQPGFQSPLASSASGGETAQWLHTFTTLSIWIILVGITGYSLFLLFRAWKGAGGINLRLLWARICRLFRAARSSTRAIARKVASSSRSTQKVEVPSGLSRKAALGRLDQSAREQIFHCYLTALQQAGKQGIPRAHNATPNEYMKELITAWPEATDATQSLTDIFITARYSRRPVSAEDARFARNILSRLKRQMKLVSPANKNATKRGVQNSSI